MTIEVRIDRIVVDTAVRHGCSRTDAVAVREAVCAELTRLLATTSAASWRAGERRRITVHANEIAADPAAWGGIIARSLCAGLFDGERGAR
ncbi:hypothetical protein NDR87_22860 [Nocardia sp. CDC159]|uniref:Uncharacterized protein n=1 Tax=Nocardia pulmonis TaxID=2951408 RepID=A0A9X2EEA7_9NOCA|nr:MULTISPECIES: hypothetical protein [Nocardia]MCM6776638.1 hypothetical protein [Nocardia pulmonis]MCM6789213.1 hypothetical protein [Nocardia sp. CDC159]